MLFLVLVRLLVQVLPAHRAEAGAVGAAQDLLRQREGDSVARPCRQVEVVVREVGRPQLFLPSGLFAWYSRAAIGTSSTASPRQR